MKFRVMDNKTGKEADPYEIALHEEWAQGLVYCDMEGFAITEDGDLVLMDECGTCVYCDPERFKVVFEDKRPHEEKKCPICGSDLYEYCFMCCYEGEKVTKNGGEDMPKSPSQECMKRGEQVREWIMQGMKEGDEK